MVKKIYFIEKTIPFDAGELNSKKISGSEKTLINITNELGKNNNLIIKVFNLSSDERIINNVIWSNISNISREDHPDYLIAMSDANLLSLIPAKNKFLWSHSVQSIEKFIRKRQLFSFFKNKPTIILEGDYHFKTRSFITSIFGKKILKLAPDDDFINTYIDTSLIPEKKAIFTTRSDRNLNFLIDSWKAISNKVHGGTLYINPPYKLSEEEKRLNIKIRDKTDKKILIDELANSRVMLNPGHRGEVYCLSAEEARELCLPIVTMGYGSLYERVEHGITGFIAKNKNEFVNYSINLMNDDQLYLKIKKNLQKIKGLRTYKHVVHDFINILYEN